MADLEVPGATLYYETAGQASAPAVLLMHSSIATLRMWDRQVDALSRDHFVIRYDARGFGRSHATDEDFSEHGDALSVLDHLGVKRATLVGCGRGGGTAIDIAVNTSGRVAGLVTIGAGPSGFPDVDITAAEDALLDKLDAAYQARDWQLLTELEVRLWCVGPGRSESNVDPAVVAEALELNRGNLPRREENPVPVPLEPPAYDRVVEIEVPTLVMVGDHDLSQHLAQHEYLCSSIPHADSARFAGAAGLPSMEQPEDFDRVLLQWLAAHGL